MSNNDFWSLVEKEKKKKFGVNSGFDISNTPTGAFGELVKAQKIKADPFRQNINDVSGEEEKERKKTIQTAGAAVSSIMGASLPSYYANYDREEFEKQVKRAKVENFVRTKIIEPAEKIVQKKHEKAIKAVQGDQAKNEEAENQPGYTGLFYKFNGGVIDFSVSWEDKTEAITNLILTGGDPDYALTNRFLGQLKQGQRMAELKFNSKKEEVELQGYYDAVLLTKQADILSKTKMPGKDYSVLEEMQRVSRMDGDKKEKRKAAVLEQMEALGIDTDNYAVLAGDADATFGGGAKVVGTSILSGLSGAWEGLASGADFLFGRPLQAIGWENNPFSVAHKFYEGEHAALSYDKSKALAEIGNGKGWQFASDAIEVTSGALPDALMAFATGGASAGSSLASKAAYETVGSGLAKIGLKVEQMMRNPNYWMSFARTVGNDYEEAKERGAGDNVATLGAIFTSLVNAGIETGVDGGSGIQGLADDLAKNKNKLWAYIESIAEEAGEEGLQKFVTEAVTKAFYDHDADILNPKEYARDMALGGIAAFGLGGVQTGAQVGVDAYNQYKANKLTTDEQTVVDKVTESLIAKEQEKSDKELSNSEKKKITKTARMLVEKGYVKAETIESILGGESYEAFRGEMDTFFGSDEFKAYKDTEASENAQIEELEAQIKELEEAPNTVGNAKKYDALQSQLEELRLHTKSKALKTQLDESAVRLRELRAKLHNEVYTRVKGSRLAESYRELYRRDKKFTADLSKYDNEYAKQTVQNILDSGLGDGTNQFRDTVEFMARISADRESVVFDLTDTEGIKKAGHYKAGYVTNGFVTDDGKITLNYDSPNMLESIVGHEITHVLEKAGNYKALRQAIFDYAISKEGLDKFNARLKEAENAYRGKKNTSPEGEVAADLIGEYLFTDYNFIANLAKTDMNGFQRMWNEVKYMFKIAVTGSKEARQLEKAKRMFEKAYSENLKGKAKTQAKTMPVEDSVQHSLGKIVDENGNSYGIGVHLDSTLLDNLTPEERVGMVKEYVKELGGELFTAYDKSGKPVDVTIAKSSAWYRNHNGKKVPVNKDLTTKYIGNEVKQEAIALIDELIVAAEFYNSEAPRYPHGWLDNKGQSDWEYWTTYIQDKNNTIWEATLNIANSANGEKILYDISPIKKVGQSVKSDTIPTGDNVAQNDPNVNTQHSFTKDSEGKELTKAQQEFFKDSKAVDSSGNLLKVYHTTNNDFTVFDKGRKGETTGDYNTYLGFFFADDPSYMGQFPEFENGKTEAYYLNITNPIDMNNISRQAFLDVVEASGGDVNEAAEVYDREYADELQRMKNNGYSSTIMELPRLLEELTGEYFDYAEFYNALKPKYEQLMSKGYDGIINSLDGRGFANEYIVLDSNQAKLTTNENPTADPDIRFSLTKYTDEEKKAHNDAVLDYFGKTYRWAETGYVLLDGSRLDLSGKHEGAPGGYRTVDHRDISDALGSDYGGDSYSGSLVQFMSEGNIRIIPECDGINLSVKPNKAQEAALSSFVSNAHGEVMLDIDDENGSTVVSVEYPRGTSAFKVLADIRGWFDNGIEPQVSNLSQFRNSLTKEGAKPNPYGYYPANDNRVYDPLADFAPVREDVAPKTAPTPKTDVAPAPVTEAEMFPDNISSAGEELANLLQRKETLEDQMQEAISAQDMDAWTKVSAEYDSLMARIEELEADEADRLGSIEDTDAPPEADIAPFERADVVPLTKKAAQDIARDVRQRLGLSNKQMYDVHLLIEEYSQSEFPDREQLFRDIKAKFGTYTESEYDETVKEAKSYLRTYGLFVSDSIKKEVADFAHLMRKNRGRIRFSKQGTDVDVLYHELNELFPHLFPEDIIAPTDQFMQMVEVANMDAESKFEMDIPDEEIWRVADAVSQGVKEYQLAQREKAANKYGRESFNSLMRDADQYVPPVREDTAPVATEPTEGEIAPATSNVTPKANTAPGKTDEPKTASERLAKKLENYQNELARNNQLRAQSNIDYDSEIARLQAEYDAKANKRSMSAHDLLRRIERMKRMKNNVDADYAKRISDIGNRIEKLSKPEAKTAAQRQTKMDEHTEKWRNLIGDTSTWKDMSLGLSYKTKTLRRILRRVVRGADGKPDIGLADQIYDELETKYDHNEALLKRESQKVKAVFEKLKLNHHEDTYAHMLGELRHNPESTLTQDVVDDYYKKHKGSIDNKKVETAISEARKTFDDLLVRVNTALREQGFKEIPYRKGYFPHFTNPKQGWLAKFLNWKTIDTEVPTSIAGLTEQFKPQRSWQSFNKERKGDTTDYSLYQGLDTYIHGALDWIYHIDDLQSRRSLENYLRYIHSEEGVKARIDEIKANEEYDADEAQALIDGVLREADNPLSGLVRELMNRTNTLANKKAAGDRELEDKTNRKVYSVLTNLNNRINANMVVGSISSALTNFIPMVQSWHQVSPYFTVRGLGDYVRSVVRDDGMIAKSDYLTNRLVEEEKLYQTGWDKVSNGAAFLMGAFDSITSQTVWRSKYLQNIKEGMSEAQAIKDADQFAKNLMAGRSRGNAPTIFDEKNPRTKLFTAFQLEVANQYGYMFDDVPKDSKNMARLVKGYATALVGAYMYNALYSSLVGRDAAFDPIKIIEELFKDLSDDDDDEEDGNVGEAILNLGENVAQELPFVGGLLGGGRIPFSSALPYSDEGSPIEGIKSLASDVKGGLNDGNWKPVVKEMLKPLYYLAMPVGGGQLKKTFEGLRMFDDDLPVAGSYTDSGQLRFPVEDTIGNRIQAGMFGQYASDNARYYFDNDIAPLAPKQIQEYKDVDIPIRDYWDYRKGLNGLDTAQEKADYINGLDLPTGKKNILINNQLDRKEPIDMTDYDDFGSLEEFDFAHKNPEKYDFFSSIGVSYQDYKNADEKGKSVYNWAFENPEKYKVSKAVTDDLFAYRQYTSDLGEIRADKDSNGKTISGSAKNKKVEYINGLDIDYGAKLIMFKDLYPADDTYNYEIVSYLNGRDDLSYEDRVAILQEIGFTVGSDGTVYWN